MAEYRTEQERMLDEIRNRTVDSVRPRSSIFIDDTVEHTGTFFAITALEDAVIDVSACTVDDFIVDADVDFTLPQGITIYGTFGSVALVSGKVIAYFI